MRATSILFSIFLVLTLVFSLTACDPMDMSSETSETVKTEKTVSVESEIVTPHIRSTDTVMPTFVDISLFDEENYSSVFLPKDFQFEAKYAGDSFIVPMKVGRLTESGWGIASGESPDSTVMACRSVNLVFARQDGKKVTATIENPTDKSLKLKDCSVAKVRFENDFYNNPKNYTAFQVNGVNNRMAITDIIDRLGTPSHFYSTSPDNYSLDYSISDENRRNGITVYINPQEDNITAVEITYYQ